MRYCAALLLSLGFIGCKQIEYRSMQLSELAHETGWSFYAVLATVVVALAVGILAAVLASRGLAWVPIVLAIVSVGLGVAGWRAGVSNVEAAMVAAADPPEDVEDVEEVDDRFVTLVLPGEEEKQFPKELPPEAIEEMRTMGLEMARKSVGVGIAGAVPCLLVGAIALARSRRRSSD